jgi:hypothetical protein
VIAELDRYHGVVLRQILVAAARRVNIGVADLAGRIDVFCLEGAAFQIKHSSKRLPPWQFTYMTENLNELIALQQMFHPVWVMLVCGTDGVVGLSIDELMSIVQVGDGGAASLRVTRSRNSMYRVSGSRGELPRAKRRGVQTFVADVFGSVTAESVE